MTDPATEPETRPDRRYVPWYRRMIPRRRTVVVFLLVIAASPFAIRWYRLSLMPDVPVPFDVEEFCEVPVSDTELIFQQAVQSLTDMDSDVSAERWSEVPESVRKQLEKNQPALSLFRQWARCPPTKSNQPGYDSSLAFMSKYPAFREFSRELSLDALRLLDQNDTHEAAELLHDTMRSTRHIGYSGTTIDRLVAMACHQLVVHRWHQWARHPEVTADQIETALMRLREDWQFTPPPSDNLKAEYLYVINLTKLPIGEFRVALDLRIDRVAKQRLGFTAEPALTHLERIVPGWQVPVLWVLGEPELTARAARLYLTHELKTCDLPFAEQPPRHAVHDELSNTQGQTAGMTADQLARHISTSMLFELFGIFPQALMRAEASRQTLLECELELQIRFRREGAATQADVEWIIAAFPWPVDPCSAEGKPIQYRAADDGLTIWSVGYDAVDQQGRVPHGANSDIVITIPWTANITDGNDRTTENLKDTE